MNWDLNGVAVGTKGTYRVVPHSEDDPDLPGSYDCFLQPTGFAEHLLLTDPSMVNARCRADAYDQI